MCNGKFVGNMEVVKLSELISVNWYICSYNPDYIKTTTTEEILLAINTLKRSPWYGHDTNYRSLLGGITRNSSGQVVSAKLAMMFFSVSIPEDAEIVAYQGDGLAVESADATTLEWEKSFIGKVRMQYH